MQSPSSNVEDTIFEETSKKPNKIPTTGLAPAESLADPISPTTSGLTDSVGEISLDKNEQVSAADELKDEAKRLVDSHVEDTQTDTQNAESRPEEPSSSNNEGQLNDSQATHIEDDFASQIQYDHSGQPVVGDFLKIQFVEHKVVPTILVN